MDRINKKKLGYYGIYVVFLGFYIWMAAQVPYTHDDWHWGLPLGIQQMITAEVNSRYIGNLIEILMARSELLKTVVLGTGYFLLPFLIGILAVPKAQEHSKEYRLVCFVACNILFFLMDRRIWQQTYGWVAGYANFSLSGIFMLLCLKEMLPVFNDDIPGYSSAAKKVGLFFLVLCTQLFIENLTVYLVAVLSFVCAVHYIKNGKISSKYLVMLLGAVCGMIIMFSSTMYTTLISTGQAVSGYRELSFSTEGNLVEKLYSCAIQAVVLVLNIWEYNYTACVAVLALLTVLALVQQNAVIRTKWCIVVVNGLFFAYLIATQYYGLHVRWAVKVLASAGFFILVAAEVLLLLGKETAQRDMLFFVWGSVLLIILPLAVTTETGARLFFTTNIFLFLFAAMLIVEIMRQCNMVGDKLSWIGIVVVVFFMIHYGTVYSEIGRAKNQRTDMIHAAVENGDKELTLPALPQKEYVWRPEPTREEWVEVFKEFYKIPENMELVFAEK